MLQLLKRTVEGFCVGALLCASVPGKAGAPARNTRYVEDLFPGLCSGLLMNARVATMPDGDLLRIDDLVIRREDLATALKQAAPWLQDELKRFALPFLERYATRRLLVEIGKKTLPTSPGETKAPAPSEGDLVRIATDRIAGDVHITVKDIEEYYRQNSALFGGAGFEEVRDYIRQVLNERARQDAVERFLREYGRGHRVEIDAAWLRTYASRALDNPVDRLRGNGAPLLAVLAAGAGGCATGYCLAGGGGEALLELIAEEYGGRLQTVLMDLRESPGLGMRFRVREAPTYLLFDGDGGELLRLEGALPPSVVIESIRRGLPVPPPKGAGTKRPARDE